MDTKTFFEVLRPDKKPNNNKALRVKMRRLSLCVGAPGSAPICGAGAFDILRSANYAVAVDVQG